MIRQRAVTNCALIIMAVTMRCNQCFVMAMGMTEQVMEVTGVDEESYKKFKSEESQVEVIRQYFV